MDETAMMKLADVIHILEFIVPDDRWLSNLPVQLTVNLTCALLSNECKDADIT